VAESRQVNLDKPTMDTLRRLC